MYKKILLSSAIAAALGTSGVANAAVDLDAASANPLKFAQEITVGSSVDLDVAAAGQNGGGSGSTNANGKDDITTNTTASNTGGAVEAAFGFTIGQGTSKYVRLGFDEPLGAALADADFGSDNANVTFSISQGGALGDTFVIVEAAQPTGNPDLQQTEKFIFVPQTGDEISATAQNDRNIAYRLFETAVDAVNETNALVSKSGQWITWGPGYEVSCTTASPARIDVVTPTQFIAGGSNTTVATVSIDDISVFKEDGDAVDIEDDYFAAGSDITIAGSTSAFTAANGFTIEGLIAGPISGQVNPDAVPASGSATFTTVTDDGATLGVFLPLSADDFQVNANGTDDMSASSYTLTIDDNGTGTYDIDSVEISCGSLLFSGSTDRLDFALTPNGVFKQFARITNPSNTDGDVTVTVYNDDGDSVSFDLGTINGVGSNTMVSDSSTKLININDIYAAAQVEDASFALAATGANSKDKLRVEVRGEFGDDAQEDDNSGETLVGRTADGIYIQGLTVSRDNNAFFQTK
jgi:hypothetical protein